jgi:hypothetical protein
MKEYKSVSKPVSSYLLKKGDPVAFKEFFEEIKQLSKDGWIVKFFNIASLDQGNEWLTYCALLERDVSN